MISMSYAVAAFAALIALWIGAMFGIFAAALCTSAGSASSCTGDCNQGRNCTCRGAGDA